MNAKAVLVTGSTSGIGLAIAREFAKAGYSVGFHGLEKEGPEIAAECGREFQVKTFYSDADLLNSPEAVNLVKSASVALGGLSVLVNNAGMQFVSGIAEFPLEKWNDVIALNLTAAFCTSKEVWSGMKSANRGRIINIASAHGLAASENKSAYVASKHGLIGLTKTLALEGAEFGITVNAICPGYVKTPLVEKQISGEVSVEQLLSKQAIKKFVKPESVAALALFLASDAGEMITGAAVSIDGGWTAQ